jgi:lysophospholipase L1-like esterase
MMGPMKRRSFLIGLIACALLAVPAIAQAKVERRAEAWVGQPAVGASANGLASILAPVRYPIQLAGRVVETRIALVDGRERKIRSWVLHERLGTGSAIRSPERRRSFTFVHRVGLNAGLSRRLRQGAWIRVAASGNLDVDEDGRPELRTGEIATRRPTSANRNPVCSSLPHLRLKRGARVSLPLPVCDQAIGWRAVDRTSRGSARVRHGRLIYTAPQGFRGSDEVQLVPKGLRADTRVTINTQVTVGAPSGLVVRALGDSVTAGFGYFASGKQMPFEDLLDCRPAAAKFNDACSSNSLNEQSKEGPVEYAPDYGLANGVSWAAQWASEYGVTNYKNYAISGSEPKNWAPGGEFHSMLEKIESEDPDYVLLTLGANPLLSNVLFGLRNMECAVESELPEFEACVRQEFAKVGLRQNLRSVYADLLANTQATIFVMRYHLSIPWSAIAYSSTEIALMGGLLNQEIASVAAELGNSRLQVITPPHFNVGVDVSPVYPSRYTCRLYPVDGPSVQSTGTQDELESHVLSFCSGPAGGGEPWVINGDTGIHPSAAGYAQMASQVPAPSP